MREGQRHGEENERGGGFVAVDARAGQIHSLGVRQRERGEERERRSGNEEGARVQPFGPVEGALRKVSRGVL